MPLESVVHDDFVERQLTRFGPSRFDGFADGDHEPDGMIVGPTTGALLHAAREVGAEPGRAVVIAPDDATKYLEAYANYL